MKVTLFTRPNGKRSVIEMTRIYEEDEKFFIENDINISLEEGMSPDEFIIYADFGVLTEDGEPDELIYISKNEECSISMRKLRDMIEKKLA